MSYEQWKEKYVKPAENAGKSGIIDTVAIRSQIDSPHPTGIEFGFKKLSERQQRILDQLPGYGSQTVVKKRDVSMLDLSALTAATGNEFAMFTKKGERLIVRGGAKTTPMTIEKAEKMRGEGYHWTGHTHVCRGKIELSPSGTGGDNDVLKAFKQKQSVIYNSTGDYEVFTLVE